MDIPLASSAPSRDRSSVELRRTRVFVLGSFPDFEGTQGRSRALLGRLADGLNRQGWDAFVSGDRRSVELGGGPLSPRRRTEVLERLADLSLYVAALGGRGDGWASEITAMQLLYPEGAERRALLMEQGYPLSAILDPGTLGYLGDPAVFIVAWGDEHELLYTASLLARHVARFGFLP